MSTTDKTSALQAALNTQVVKANLLYGAERLYINVYWQWATQHDTILYDPLLYLPCSFVQLSKFSYIKAILAYFKICWKLLKIKVCFYISPKPDFYKHYRLF